MERDDNDDDDDAFLLDVSSDLVRSLGAGAEILEELEVLTAAAAALEDDKDRDDANFSSVAARPAEDADRGAGRLK